MYIEPLTPNKFGKMLSKSFPGVGKICRIHDDPYGISGSPIIRSPFIKLIPKN